jgi:hypothetical protein
MLLLCGLFAAAALTGCSGSAKLTRGTIEGNTYTNEFGGLTFEKPESWVYATDEEIAEIMGIGADLISDPGTDFEKAMLEKQSIYDMMAQDNATGSNVIVYYENLALVVGGTKTTEDEYIELLKKGLADAAIFQYEFSDVSEQVLCGETYHVLTAKLTDIGGTQTYYVRRVGKYIQGAIVSAFGEDNVAKITGYFK